MAPGSNKFQSELWKIAKNPKISPDACWEELETWLEVYHVDLKSRTSEEWMKSLNEIRHKIEGIQNSAPATRSPSSESERQPDNDSGYGPSEKSDQVDAVFVLSEAHPDGKVPLSCCYSERYGEDYVTDEACKRIGNPRMSRGKVTLTYIPSGQTKSIEGTFTVVKYDDAEADVGFKIKVPEETPMAPAERTGEDLATGMQLQIDTQHGGKLTLSATHESTDIPLAVGSAFLSEASQVKSKEDCMSLGQRIKYTLDGARKAG